MNTRCIHGLGGLLLRGLDALSPELFNNLRDNRCIEHHIWRDAVIALIAGCQHHDSRLDTFTVYADAQADGEDREKLNILHEHGLGGFSLGAFGCGEYVGTQQFKELATCSRYAISAPFADAGLFDLAESGHGGSSAEQVDDLGVVHGASIGIPTLVVNRQSYS